MIWLKQVKGSLYGSSLKKMTLKRIIIDYSKDGTVHQEYLQFSLGDLCEYKFSISNGRPLKRNFTLHIIKHFIFLCPGFPLGFVRDDMGWKYLYGIDGLYESQFWVSCRLWCSKENSSAPPINQSCMWVILLQLFHPFAQ